MLDVTVSYISYRRFFENLSKTYIVFANFIISNANINILHAHELNGNINNIQLKIFPQIKQIALYIQKPISNKSKFQLI